MLYIKIGKQKKKNKKMLQNVYKFKIEYHIHVHKDYLL